MKTKNCMKPYISGIYNEAPRNYPFSDNPLNRIKHIRSMNFNAVHVLPLLKTVNGSSYAPDYSLNSIDYDPRCFACSLDKESIDPQEAEQYIRMFTSTCIANGLVPIYDAVLGHCGVGARIVSEAPEFFARDENGDIVHQSCPDMVYDDLLRFDYESRPAGLFEFALGIIEKFVQLGFRGFRCDMSVHLSEEMWKYVIGHIKEKFPDIIFIGESFGTTPDKILGLKRAGFDMYYNSSFWWKLGEGWLVEQTELFADAGLSSVGIIANHDTERWLSACGSVEVAEMKMKLMIWLNCAVSITAGDEYGVTKRYNVFTASPYSAEEEPGLHDFTSTIRNALAVKKTRPALQAERFVIKQLSGPLYIIRKEADGDICEMLINSSPKAQTLFYNEMYVTAEPFSVTIVC